MKILKQFTRLAALLFCSPVFAQQHPVDCPRGTSTACTLTAPANTTQIDPPWLMGGKFNADFTQLFGITGIVYASGPNNPLTAATGAQILAALGLSGVTAGSYTSANITVDQ